MDCEQTREALMSLPASAFDGLTHLRTCAGCRAFADRLRTADGAMAAHVETYAGAGDFATDWARAQATVRRRRPGFGRTAAFGLLALAATALLVLRPPADGPEPTIAAPAPVEAAPVAAAPVVAAPPVAPPPPVVAAPPMATAPPTAAPRPTRTRPPTRLPSAVTPAATPAGPQGPVGGRSIVVRIDPALPEVRTAELTCGALRLRATRSGDTVRFDGVPDGPCTLGLDGAFRGPLPDGDRWRLDRVNGAAVLVPDAAP